MRTKLGLALIAFLVCSNVIEIASAEVYIEPFLGYRGGRWEQGANNQKFKGTAAGLRLGYYILGLSVAAEYQGSKLKDNSSPSNLDMKASDYGLYVGFEFPILLRVYGTLYPSSKLTADGGTISKSYKGNGMKVGLGITTLPFLDINIEYQTNTYEQQTSDVTVTSKELKATAIGLNLSFPLEL